VYKNIKKCKIEKSYDEMKSAPLLFCHFIFVYKMTTSPLIITHSRQGLNNNYAGN